MASSSWLPSLFGDRKEQADPFLALRKQMDDAFEDFFRAAPSGFLPSADVSETDEEIRIVAELPGVDRDDIDVTLKGEKRSEAEEKDETSGRRYHRVERSFGSFQRTMAVPFEIDPSAVAAEFKDGVLTVTVAKPAEVVANSRKIEVKASS